MDDNVEILRRYNRWRRGQALWNAAADFPNPRVVDEAIDAACDEIERLRAENEALNAVYKAAKRCVANPAWAGICDEDVELELAVAALAAKGE